jgi:hypothetical protein
MSDSRKSLFRCESNSDPPPEAGFAGREAHCDQNM